MKRTAAPLFFVFLMACTVMVSPLAGPYATAKKAAVDSGLSRVDSADFSAQNLSQVDRLYAQLEADYGYLAVPDPLAGFAEGAPALTREAAALALRNARSAAAKLISASAGLETLFADREKGNVSASDFEKDLFEKLGSIEALAREIRNDVYVDILGKLEGKTGEVATPVDQELPAVQLRRLAEEMEQGIASYGVSQSVQVVSIQDLRRPSLNSIAGAIEQLTQNLRADRRAAFRTTE